MRNNDKFPLIQRNFPISEFHCKSSFYNQKQLVLILVMVPYKFSFELYEFHFLPIELCYYFWTPMFTE